MPIYLVRWPDLSAALVKARSEDELAFILDQVANPEGCTWSVYRGPLFIEFAPPVKYRIERDAEGDAPLRPEQIVIEDVGGFYEAPLVASVPEAEGAGDMMSAILKRAFPHIHRAFEAGEGAPDEEALGEAARADLAPLLRSSWRRVGLERRTDAKARIARDLDLSEDMIERLKGLAESPPAPDDTPEEDG